MTCLSLNACRINDCDLRSVSTLDTGIPCVREVVSVIYKLSGITCDVRHCYRGMNFIIIKNRPAHIKCYILIENDFTYNVAHVTGLVYGLSLYIVRNTINEESLRFLLVDTKF